MTAAERDVASEVLSKNNKSLVAKMGRLELGHERVTKQLRDEIKELEKAAKRGKRR
jgi:hypothetical protein